VLATARDPLAAPTVAAGLAGAELVVPPVPRTRAVVG
jgi:hypothetical protein